MNKTISALVLPALFIGAWILTFLGATPPGALASDSLNARAIHWMLYFSGYAFGASSVMHSIFAKKMAQSIGWVTNGFQYEIASVCLGLSIGCFYALQHGRDAQIAISLPVITFLFFAGINHAKEMIINKNLAPNNTFILIWDFGISISLAALLLTLP